MQRSGSRENTAPGMKKAGSLTSEALLRYKDAEKDKPLKSARARQRTALMYAALILLPASLLHIYRRGLAASVTEGEKGVQYEIVIDAGSSGSRVHVFRYTFDRGVSLPELMFPDEAMKSTPGLSSYAGRPVEAGDSLLPLLEFAAHKVPKWAQQRTRLVLYATAGLRMLRKSAAEAILESCRTTLASSPFRFDPEDASILSGSNEGIYGWVAANYGSGRLARMLAASEDRGLAVVELGGASAQVTFIHNGSHAPAEQNQQNQQQQRQRPADPVTLSLGESLPPLSVFTHSFLGAGQEAAQEQAREVVAADEWQEEWRRQRGDTDETEEIAVKLDPCYPPGWVQDDGTLGHGNFSMCRNVASALVEQQGCSKGQVRCIGGVDVPLWAGPVLAIENFHYTAEMLGLSEDATVQDFASAGDRYCSTRWEDLVKKYPGCSSKQLLKYCFSTAYIVTLLTEGLGIDVSERRLRFANQVTSGDGQQAVDVDWAMGHVVVSAALRGAGSVVAQPRMAARLELVASSIVAVTSAFILCSEARMRIKASPSGQIFKTGSYRAFYDLEKGGYRYASP